MIHLVRGVWSHKHAGDDVLAIDREWPVMVSEDLMAVDSTILCTNLEPGRGDQRVPAKAVASEAGPGVSMISHTEAGCL